MKTRYTYQCESGHQYVVITEIDVPRDDMPCIDPECPEDATLTGEEID